MKHKNVNNFYNLYHRENKNRNYYRLVSRYNFTYYWTIFYLEKVLQYLGAKKVEILDVGCGVGTIDFYLANLGHKVTGIDVSSDAIKIAKNFRDSSVKLNSAKFFNVSVENFAFKKNLKKFDMVICSEVIEHVPDEDKLLKSIHQVLKPNGYLFLSTPSENAPLYRLGFLEDFDRRVGHLRRYNMDNLTKLLVKNGFEVREAQKTESFLRNSLFTFKPLGFFIKLLRFPILVKIYHFFDQILVNTFGESDLVIIAKKK